MNEPQYPFPDMPSSADFSRFWRKLRPWLTLIGVVIALLILGWASYYQVEPDEVGVVTRFGKFKEISEPGPHLKIPFVDAVVNIKAKQQLNVAFGFRTIQSGIKSSFARDLTTQAESLMLTGDLNVVMLEWIVHYQIADPYSYLFKVRDMPSEETLRALGEATMREVIGDYSIDEVLTTGREEILQHARQRLAEMCERFQTGVTIQRIELRNAAPPDPVKPSFNEVNQAEQERDRLQNEAWAEYNKEIPAARGRASQVLQEAEGYAAARVNRARGDADRFIALSKEHARSPKVTRTRLWLETMDEVLTRVGHKTFIDDQIENVVIPSDGKAVVLPGANGGQP